MFDNRVDTSAGLKTCSTATAGGRYLRFVVVGTFAIAVTCFLEHTPSAAQAGALKNAIGMEFVKIPAGEFTMGCSSGDNSCKNEEKPQHQVRITKSLEMGKYEVTQAQWK